MKKRYFKLVTYCMLVVLLPGCCNFNRAEHTPYRVISQVRVFFENGPLEAHRTFIKPEKIQRIVGYLRYIDPYGAPTDNPEEAIGSNFLITIDYSDGSHKTYHQRADRFMRMGNGPWKRIDPQKAMELSRILGMLSGDSPAVDAAPVPPLLRPYL